MSVKSYFSSRAAWPMALSARARAVTPPYFPSSSFSREPPLTPMRMGIRPSRQASATARTWSSPPMLPGLMRILSTPRAAHSRASRWSKWMSATRGMWIRLLMLSMALAAAMSGTATRTISHPAASSRRI